MPFLASCCHLGCGSGSPGSTYACPSCPLATRDPSSLVSYRDVSVVSESAKKSSSCFDDGVSVGYGRRMASLCGIVCAAVVSASDSRRRRKVICGGDRGVWVKVSDVYGLESANGSDFCG